MSYLDQQFTKVLKGKKAPKGFHYMPNGRLMKDTDHIERYGRASRFISLDMSTSDINSNGEQRKLTIVGDAGAYFSIQIFDNSNNYYDFETGAFVSNITGIKNIELKSNSISYNINFPAHSGVSLKNYTINITSEIVGNIQTFHTRLIESRNADNSINLNKSVGSNSNLLKKVLYQDAAKSLHLSCVAPSLYTAITSTVDGAVSSSNRVVLDDDIFLKRIAVGDLVTGTGVASSDHRLVSILNPDGDNTKELQLDNADSISDGVTLTFTPPFNGMTPHKTDSTTGRATITTSSGASFSSGFSITVTAPTSRSLFVRRLPNISDLTFYKEVTIGSAGLALEDENTSSSSLFFRFPVDNIAGLNSGMVLDPSRTFANKTVTPSFISSYRTTIDTKEILETDFNTIITNTTVLDKTTDAVDAGANPITAVDRNGLVTAQAGNIIFNNQQRSSLASESNVAIYGYGAQAIKSLTGATVSLSNLNIEQTQVSTTVTSGVSNSTTVPLTELSGISAGSIVRGPGIDSSAANPTVVKKSAPAEAGNVLLSAAQTIENGQTLFFDGGCGTLTITGTITVENMPISDTTLYFDVERFLQAR